MESSMMAIQSLSEDLSATFLRSSVANVLRVEILSRCESCQATSGGGAGC